LPARLSSRTVVGIVQFLDDAEQFQLRIKDVLPFPSSPLATTMFAELR
jgi:hypothetical protein